MEAESVLLFSSQLTPDRTRVFRVALDNPVPVELFTVDFVVLWAALGGDSLFVVGKLSNPVELADAGAPYALAAAVNVASGETRWKTFLQQAQSGPERGAPGTVCEGARGNMVLGDGVLIVACALNTGLSAAAWALDSKTGLVRWTWDHGRADGDPTEGMSPTMDPQSYVGGALYKGLGATTLAPHWDSYASGVSIHEGLALVSVFTFYPQPQSDPQQALESEKFGASLVYALNLSTGQREWLAFAQPFVLTGLSDSNVPPSAVAAAGRLFLELDDLHVLTSTEEGGTQHRVAFRPNSFEGDPGSGMAASANAVFATSRSALHRIDLETLGVDWTLELPQNLQWGPGGLALAGGLLYGRAGPMSQEALTGSFPVLVCVEAHSGRIVWTRGFGSDADFAVGSGTVGVWEWKRGFLTVIGVTGASPRPQVQFSSPNPRPAESLAVSMAGTGPGFFGQPTSFRADWGDGTGTDWQSSPRFEHRYASPIDAFARFSVRNEAGQTASAVVVFHVGETSKLNFLQTQFSNENQDRTFFILGLALTLLGALYGFWRLRRNRAIIDRELRAVEHAYIENREDPNRLEPALAERKNHVRGLLAEGSIDQAGFLLLERRIDELGRNRRLETVDQSLKFLPMSLFETLREMLSDGRVTEWEHRHFIDALKHDKVLTADQKILVRRQIDAWFERDRTTH